MPSSEKIIFHFINELWNDKTIVEKDQLYSNFSPNLIINSPLGKVIGLKNFHKINDHWNVAFPNMLVDELEIQTYGNAVVTNWRSTGTHMRTFKGMKPSGNKISYRGETIFCFEHGKVVRYSCQIDMVDVFKQMGVLLFQEEYSGQAIISKDKAALIERINQELNPKLTPRQAECLSLSFMGFSAKQIAMLLGNAYRTVETLLTRALHRHGYSSKLHALEENIENKILPLWQDLGKILVKEYEDKQESLSSI